MGILEASLWQFSHQSACIRLRKQDLERGFSHSGLRRKEVHGGGEGTCSKISWKLQDILGTTQSSGLNVAESSSEMNKGISIARGV